MKKLILLTIILGICHAFSQNNWQKLMHDRNSNFYDVQKDFELFNQSFQTNNKTIPKGKGIKQFKRWEYYWQNRVDENGNFPPEGHVLNEINNYNQSLSQLNGKYATGSGNWSLVGPLPTPLNGTTQLNGSGRLNCIAFHPTDNNTIFVGAPAGGFWKTTDNGGTWTEFSNGLVRLGVSSIVVHPTDPNTIYIGTGDRDAGDAPGYGVWKTTDGGVNWVAHNTGMGNRTVNEIIMHPTNPDIMVAATNNGYIYRTSNGGTTWTASNFLGINALDIAMHPANPNIIYASGTGFYKSTDGGVNFNQVTTGVPSAGVQRMAIAVSANQSNWVYILAGGGSGLIGIYRSIDSGTSFSTRTTSPNILGYQTNGSGTDSQAWYDLVIAADPTDANVIYTGGVNLWKSTNGGTTMNCVSYWVGPSGSIDGVHADQHALEFSPLTNVLYNGNDGGLYYTGDNGTNWTDISSGLAIAQLYKIGVAQTVENTIINGHQDNGTSVNRGGVFTTEIGGDGMECIIDPTNASYMYGALYYGDINRSNNGGTTFTGITGGVSEQGGWVTPYKLDPNNANTMFAGYANIWRNTAVRTGTTWSQISNFGGTSTIVDLAVAPSNSNTLYVSRNGTNKFYSTTNALAGSPTWTNLTGNLPVASTPKDIEVDPNNPNHLFIALGNDIYESNNAGASWTNISGTLPNISLNAIVIDHANNVGAMYVGMDVGVYYKDNNQADWQPYSTSLANVEVTELEIYANATECKSKLYASTYGQGVWVSDLKDPGNIAPTACFEVNTITGCVGTDFVFTDLSDFTPTSWSWNITPATFVYVNGTSSSSQNPQVRFTAAGNYTVELTATNTNGSDVQTKISYITVVAGTNASSFNEDFESQTLCSVATDCGTTICGITGMWINLTNGTDDNIDWRVDDGGTASAGTGPSVDFNPGTAAGNYAYLEASGTCTGQTAILESQCMILDQGYDFKLGYHMFGAAMGSLHLDLYVDGLWQEDVIPLISGDKGDVWNVATLDLTPHVGKTIKLRIRGITGTDFTSDMAIDDIKLVAKCSNTTTWNGTTWSNGVPTIFDPAVIAGDYTTTSFGSFKCCSLIVNSGVQLDINSGDYVVVDNEIVNNGGLTVKNNGSLVQINDNDTNVGNIAYERVANIRLKDYVFWSSPVKNFNVSNISTDTPSNYIFKWDPVFNNPNGAQGYWIGAANENMISGKGYIVRGPNSFTTTPQNFLATFDNGAPNNGEILVPISRGNYTGADYLGNNSVTVTRYDDNWNLVGNPYPSSINVTDFLNLNSTLIEGAVRIWTHGTLPSTSNGNPYYGSFSSNYSVSDFIVHNGTGTVSGIAGFNGYVAGGQGFMVLMNDGAALTDNLRFNNSLRNETYLNSQFYKNEGENNEQKNRIWLDLVNGDNVSDRTLIGYLDGATLNKDRLYDAFTKVEPGQQRIYSFIGTDKMIIQGLGLPFVQDDQIPVGVNVPISGSYKIAIHDVDGLFEEMPIFIEDKDLNIIADISQQPYDFYSEGGEFNNRFVLRFENQVLSEELIVSENNVVITSEEGINIKSLGENIKSIQVFDVLGRKIYENGSVNVQEIELDSIVKSNSALLFKVTLNNNKIVLKKFIF